MEAAAEKEVMDIAKLGKVLDLSHVLVPGEEEFPLEIETKFTDEVMSRIQRKKDTWYILQTVTIGSHSGTHIEFPYHHVKEGMSAAEYPLDRMMGETVLLDFSHKKKDEIITKEDIIETGIEIREGDILFIRTDMDKLWKTPQGHDRPCLSIEATQWLVEEIKIKLIGTDATGLEVRGRDDQPVHMLLLGNDVAKIESLKDLDKIKQTRFNTMTMPIKVKGMDACPVRVTAFLNE